MVKAIEITYINGQGVKPCSRCKQTLPIYKFAKLDTIPCGKQYACIDCNIKKRRKYRKENHARLTENDRKRWFIRAYGITVDDFKRMSKEQDHKCAICNVQHVDYVNGKNLIKRLHIDHCHATGKVRRLLCNNCNVGLGNFKDNTELLLKAVDYLGKY